MSTKTLSSYCNDESDNGEESVDDELNDVKHEAVTESLTKDKTNLLSEEAFQNGQKQGSRSDESNKKCKSNSSFDETYDTSEEANSEIAEAEYTSSQNKSPIFRGSAYSHAKFLTGGSDTSQKNMSDKSDKKKAKEAQSDENSENREKQSLSPSGDSTDSTISKPYYQFSQNSPVIQTVNAKRLTKVKRTEHTLHNELNSDIYNRNNECVHVAQITNALKSFDAKMRCLHIRPPWRDPNSKPLPSDRTTAVYKMYEDYLKCQNQRPFSKLERSTSQCINDKIAVHRLYHSTLNRYRQNEKIQMENYELAKRLQKIRPTTGMTREEQLRDYKKYFVTPNSSDAYSKTILPPHYQRDSYINHSTSSKNKNSTKIMDPKPRDFIIDSRQTTSSFSTSVRPLQGNYNQSQMNISCIKKKEQSC
uniref:Uncharacterized protein n=2 Tax=Trichobilharzia regenti TaxID=157069 RepID=A0AA85K7T2_TRIRE|nr:unnamed protein product [Trichobilharzia regenti]